MDIVKGYLSDAVMGKVSDMIGIDSSAAGSAMGSAIPALLGGLMKKSSSLEGAESIMGLLKNQDGGMLDDLSGFLGNTNMDSMNEMGGGLLNSLLGDKLGGIIDLVGKVGGIGSGKSKSLLSFVAPLIMSVIGKQVKSSGLGASGLMDLLAGQREHVERAAPAGLSGLLGLAGLKDSMKDVGDGAKAAANKTAEVAGDTAKAGGGLLKKLLPILLLAVAAVFLMKMMKGGCNGDAAIDGVKDAGTSVVEGAGDVVDAAGETTGDLIDGAGDLANAAVGSTVEFVDAFGNKVSAIVKSIKLPGGVDLNVRENGTEWNFYNLLNDNGDCNNGVVVDNIRFVTGSAELDGEETEQLNNLVAIMNAMPNANVKVIGHTDNTGDAAANQTLSENRAFSVKSYMVARGIKGDRIDTEGAGQVAPIATNDTEEGRAQNRRIELYCVK